MGSPRFKAFDVDGFKVTDAWFPPGEVLPPHVHEWTVFAVMLEGSFQDVFRSRSYPCPPATVFTTAVSLVHGLDTALGLILDEGLDAVFERHVRLGRACRAGVKAMGLELFSPDEDRSAVVTASILGISSVSPSTSVFVRRGSMILSVMNQPRATISTVETAVNTLLLTMLTWALGSKTRAADSVNPWSSGSMPDGMKFALNPPDTPANAAAMPASGCRPAVKKITPPSGITSSPKRITSQGRNCHRRVQPARPKTTSPK